jgi:hypothetical protein
MGYTHIKGVLCDLLMCSVRFSCRRNTYLILLVILLSKIALAFDKTLLSGVALCAAVSWINMRSYACG